MIFDHPLDGARAKVTRAMQHAVVLRKHCEHYSSSAPTGLSVEHIPTAGVIEVILDSVKNPPPFLGSILGDVAHNLRSALDQVTWQLALSGPDAAALDNYRLAKTIQFPITSSRNQFSKLGVLRYLDSETRARVERWQPFNNLEGGTHLVNPLAILQAVSNTDKHRLMIPAVGRLNLDDIEIHSSITLDLDRAEILVEDVAHVEASTALARIPCLDDDGFAQARLKAIPLPEFWIEDIGMLRTDQAVLLVEQISDVVEDLGQAFPPANDFEARREGWLTPDL